MGKKDEKRKTEKIKECKFSILKIEENEIGRRVEHAFLNWWAWAPV